MRVLRRSTTARHPGHSSEYFVSSFLTSGLLTRPSEMARRNYNENVLSNTQHFPAPAAKRRLGCRRRWGIRPLCTVSPNPDAEPRSTSPEARNL